MFSRDARGAALLGGLRLDFLFEPGGALEPLPTPAYVYDLDGIEAEARELDAAYGALPHLVAYAVKANSAGPILRALAAAGCGADVVSGGELSLALGAGFSPERVLFSGVAKKAAELDAAIGAGDAGILAIQAESVEELGRVDARARALGRRARVSLRVNPSVEAETHSHVATGHDEAKFGIATADLGAALEVLEGAAGLSLVGLSCHVGSQLTATGAYLEGASRLCEVARSVEARLGEPLAFLDFGGGFGVDYGQGCPARPADFARAAAELAASRGFGQRRLVAEPGRALVASHGVLCAGVVGEKRSRAGRRWLQIDAGMNDLLRPALYGARHRIEPTGAAPAPPDDPEARWRVVGPVCESSDDFGEHPLGREAPGRVVVRDAGAYGFTMASEYNGRALPLEVFLRGGEVAELLVPRSPEAWVASRLESRPRGPRA